MCAFDRRFKQRRRDRAFRCIKRTVVASRRADAHERGARALHHGLHVVEVNIDETGSCDEVGDALYATLEHLVGSGKSAEHTEVRVLDIEQAVVGDDDERVDLFAEAINARIGLLGTAAAFEGERASHHAHRERTLGARNARDHRRATGSRATAFACGDKHHVRAAQRLGDLVLMVFSGLAPHFRIGTSSETTGQLTPDVELDVSVGHQQRLRVCIDRDELGALEAHLDHSIDGVHSTAADADDLDRRDVVLR